MCIESEFVEWVESPQTYSSNEKPHIQARYRCVRRNEHGVVDMWYEIRDE